MSACRTRFMVTLLIALISVASTDNLYSMKVDYEQPSACGRCLGRTWKAVQRRVEACCDRLEFIREFWNNYKTVGAVTRSSRYFADAITKPLQEHKRRNGGRVNILEAGAGDGAFTLKIIESAPAGSTIVIVELLESFYHSLFANIAQLPAAIKKNKTIILLNQDICTIGYNRDVQKILRSGGFDFIISALPLSTLGSALVIDILEKFTSFIKPATGVVTYARYKGCYTCRLSPMNCCSGRAVRDDLRATLLAVQEFDSQAAERSTISVWRNIPPTDAVVLTGFPEHHKFE